jgi:DNA-binding CsgD family transcriptional regulator
MSMRVVRRFLNHLARTGEIRFRGARGDSDRKEGAERGGPGVFHEARTRRKLAHLTPAQRYCLRAHLRGQRRRKTARLLGVSPSTVTSHLRAAIRAMRRVPQLAIGPPDLPGYPFCIGSLVPLSSPPDTRWMPQTDAPKWTAPDSSLPTGSADEHWGGLFAGAAGRRRQRRKRGGWKATTCSGGTGCSWT